MINAQLTIEKKTIITIIKSTLSIIDDNKKTIEIKKVIACLLDDRGGGGGSPKMDCHVSRTAYHLARLRLLMILQ